MKELYMKNARKDVAAGIVTYNPDINRLLSCIKSVDNQVDRIIIVDNGSYNINDIEKMITPQIVIEKWERNQGIGLALKRIMELSAEKGFLWVLTIDQDSIVREGLVDEYLVYSNKREFSNVGLFSCLIKDRNFVDKKNEVQTETAKMVDTCITSGSFCSVLKYSMLEGYDPSFFIDCVDFDLCYQMKEAGFDICRLNYVGLLHETGHGENKRFLFWIIVVYHHDAKRVYTLSRNLILLWRKHPELFGLWKLVQKEMILFLRIILFENMKKEKLQAFFCGIARNRDVVKKYE